MWKKQAHQGFSSTDAADIVFNFRTQIRITLTSAADLLDDAYRLAVTHKRTVYDMLSLALSLREGCRFVTADAAVVAISRPRPPRHGAGGEHERHAWVPLSPAKRNAPGAHRE
ncbi:MAG TPA: type II toxin-antitoxin system VapC family toxin, partial [Blastocatellia bacterium]|nr:type II toxin-antitoxin system VapC family toxin [Blastocatellia bacterium]